MADWDLPVPGSNYLDIINFYLPDRDLDSAQMFLTEPANPVDGMIKLVRSPVKLQERGGGTWNDRPLSVAGGGTGAATPAGALLGLGLGTMALQYSNAVNISDGLLAGNGFGLANLQANNIAHGALNAARLPDGGTKILTSPLAFQGFPLHLAGLELDVRGITGNDSVLTSDSTLVVFTGTGSRILSLPAVATVHGKVVVIYKWDTINTVLLDPFGSETIDGAASKTLYIGQEATIIQAIAGTGWITISGGGGGGVKEIVHDDVSFGTGEFDKNVLITWTKGTPTSRTSVDFRINGALEWSHAGNSGRVVLTWEILDATHATVHRVYLAGASGVIQPAAYPWSAYHIPT